MWDIGVPGVVLGQYDVVWNQKGRGEKGRRAREKKLDGNGGRFPKYYALGCAICYFFTCLSLFLFTFDCKFMNNEFHSPLTNFFSHVVIWGSVPFEHSFCVLLSFS